MINGLEGIPGSGKSYEAVVFHVLEALKTGRKVITNLPLNIELFGGIDPSYPGLLEVRRKPRPVLGTWDANRVDDNGNGNAFELFPPGQLAPENPTVQIFAGPHQSAYVRASPVDLVTFGHVWDFYDTWRHADGRGALFIIDECHVPFPAVGTDKQVVEWFKLHRHFNVDVLFMTQSFRDMNQSMARLIAMLIKVRKADILGKKNEYIRKVYSGYRGAVISTNIRPYLPQYFPLYKSHTQGNSIAESGASDVAPFLVKFKRFQWAFTIISVLICAWAFWPESKPKPVFHESVQRQLKENSSRPPTARAAPVPLAAASAPLVVPTPEPEIDPEPLREKLIHITGWIKSKTRSLHTFAVSAGGARIFDVSQHDLLASGYAWKPLGECMGYLTYKAIVRTVTCDPPTMAAGSNYVPIVIADGSRRSSVDKPVSSAVSSEFKLR
jgi:zona occludens toxin